jgi:hypothetical protein
MKTQITERALAVPSRVVDPHSVYTADEFRRDFRLRESSIRCEVREGRLRVA